MRRLELPTSRLSGVRSNRLSYKPAVTTFFIILAPTYSPTPSPVQYLRPLKSKPSCSGCERVFPNSASAPEIFRLYHIATYTPLCFMLVTAIAL